MLLVGGSPTPNHFLLFVQKKVIKENHTLRPWLSASLRDSSSKASAELTSFKQSSTTTPCLIALLGMAKGLN
jgi:hypothetical protein